MTHLQIQHVGGIHEAARRRAEEPDQIGARAAGQGGADGGGEQDQRDLVRGEGVWGVGR